MVIDRASLSYDNLVIDATIHSRRRSYGTKVPKSRKEKAQGAKKLKATLLEPKVQPENSGPVKEKTPKGSHKEYGSHNGSEHTFDLLVKEITQFSDLTEGEVNSLCNAMTSIESYKGTSIDILAEKNRVESQDAETDSKFRQTYGVRLSNVQALALANEKAKHAFTYYETQVVVKLISKEERDGFEKDPSGSFIKVIRSKRVYTSQLIPIDWIRANCKISSEEVPVQGVKRQVVAQLPVYRVLPNGEARFISPSKAERIQLSGYAGAKPPDM